MVPLNASCMRTIADDGYAPCIAWCVVRLLRMLASGFAFVCEVYGIWKAP